MEKISITKMEERDEEAEETLSFCDLPLNSSDSEHSFFSLQSSSDDTLFEFSISEDLSGYPAENILFFGKSISLKMLKKNKPRPDSDDWVKRVYGKTSVLSRRRTVAPANARWPLLMVGPPPVEKKRSSRSSVVDVSATKIKREKKMWGMIKVLGCGPSYLAVA